MSERTDYLVLLPTECDGVDHGELTPLRVTAETREDAVKKACAKWYGNAPPREGIAVVVPSEYARAFVIGELKGVEITAETSLPDSLSKLVSK